MPKLPEIVTKKIGPLPLWSYVVIGGVFVFILRKRGGGSSAGAGGAGISIPTLQPGSPSSPYDGAVGSPGQNAMGGMDTQPGGAAPWWSTPPAWWAAGPGGGQDTANTAGGGGNTGLQSSASPGRVLGKTAGELAKEPAGGWTSPPLFQQTSPTEVRDLAARRVGKVNPLNRLLGYSDPVTGNLFQSPNGGPAIWA